MGKKKLNKKSPSKPNISPEGISTKKNNLVTEICDKHCFTNDDSGLFQNELLKWYDKEQRDLPWRFIAKTETDPDLRGYAVWVSEVMLQQTQVATVIPYFNNWMKKWPSIQALADANVEEVLQAWAGLGYYSRGRRLHEGANIIVNKLHGHMPSSVTDLMKSIPGIGAYSASAIASIAYQKPVGVVDGNVIRVLCRYRTIGANTTMSAVRDHLWDLANKLVSKERPGDFNQALMEFGAIICTPQNPSCSKCPVSTNCKALHMAKHVSNKQKLQSFLKSSQKKIGSVPKTEVVGITDIEDVASSSCSLCIDPKIWKENSQVTAFPCKVEKKAARLEKVYVLVIENDDKLLMVKRPEKGLLAGLWEFPCVVLGEDSDDGVVKAAESLRKEWGIPQRIFSTKKSVGEVVHLFSHIHSTYVIESLCLKEIKSLSGRIENEKCVWFSLEEIKEAAVSTAMKKVLAQSKKTEEKSSKQPSSKKRKRSPDSHKQTSIKSFFS